MSTIPTASTLQSSSEAFKYPLPAVRQLHKQLETALDDKNARLRTLVGGSYRQLLNTAETIIAMRHDIEVVEQKLARVADACGKSTINKKITGLAKFCAADEGMESPGTRDLRNYARFQVLDNCLFAIDRLSRRLRTTGTTASSVGSRLLASAKLLVLARLLFKALSDAKSISGVAADLTSKSLLARIGALRRKILARISRFLQKPRVSKESLADVLCAYSIATSSGAMDILRHFLHLRGEAIAVSFDSEEGRSSTDGQSDGIIRALELYSNTLFDVQALFPKTLSEKLEKQKLKPLLQDADIRGVEGLQLDLCENWFGHAVLHFTPYIRHDDLIDADVVSMLRSWAMTGAEVLVRGLRQITARQSEIKSVVALRSQALKLWIREGSKPGVFVPAAILDDLRAVFNERLSTLSKARIDKLHLIETELEAALAECTTIIKPLSMNMWADEESDLSRGASGFRNAIMSRINGHENAVSRILNGYDTWRRLVDDLSSTVSQLKSQRWDDDSEMIDDDLIVEDRRVALSIDDPGMLQKRIDRSLKQAFYDLHDKLVNLSNLYQESTGNALACSLLLRVIRDIRTSFPASSDVGTFGLSLIPQLHQSLALSAAAQPMVVLRSGLARKQVSAGRGLWEGTPELPVYPSPHIFTFLKSLTSAMSDLGHDLWSPAAVSILRRCLSKEVAEVWQLAIQHLNKEASDAAMRNGVDDDVMASEAETGSSSDNFTVISDTKFVPTIMDEAQIQDLRLQWLFDLYLLTRALGERLSSPDYAEKSGADCSLFELKNLLLADLPVLVASDSRVADAAGEYWKRTNLLFGLLH